MNFTHFNNPYFLYQTDGEAVILQSAFELQSNAQIESDIEFNSCIFTCGESAIVNGDSHDELQRNDITSFISNPQNNASKINVTYYYPAIEDYITLQSVNLIVKLLTSKLWKYCNSEFAIFV